MIVADDGVNVAGIQLYRNSGYKKGFIRAKYGDVGGGGFYSKIYCKQQSSKMNY